MVKKIISWVINSISILMILLSVTVLMTVVFTRKGDVPNYLGYSVFRVLTGSMEPTIPVDTMCVVKLCKTDEVEEGDVISFYTLEPEILGSVVTHRAVEITKTENGERLVYTKGDANPAVDSYPVTDEYMVGKVVFTSVFWGKLVRLATNPLIFVIFILGPLFAILISYLVTTIRTAKALEKEELEKELQRLSDERQALKEQETEATDAERKIIQ